MAEPKPILMYSKSWKATDLTEYAREAQVREVLEKLFPYTYGQSGQKQQHFDIKSRTGGFLRIEAAKELSKEDIAACYKKPATGPKRRITGLDKYT